MYVFVRWANHLTAFLFRRAKTSLIIKEIMNLGTAWALHIVYLQSVAFHRLVSFAFSVFSSKSSFTVFPSTSFWNFLCLSSSLLVPFPSYKFSPFHPSLLLILFSPFTFVPFHFPFPFPLLLTIQNKCRYQEVISPPPLSPLGSLIINSQGLLSPPPPYSPPPPHYLHTIYTLLRHRREEGQTEGGRNGRT